MRLRDFLKDKWTYGVAALISALFSAELLTALGAGTYAAFYVSALVLLAQAVALAAEYIQKRLFYRSLLRNLEQLDKKYLLSEMTEEPSFTEGRLLARVLRETGKSMNDSIAGYRRESQEFREYVETWVHEIKTPISACGLILENNPGELARVLSRDFQRIETYVDQALYYARSGNVEKDYVMKRTTIRELVSSALKKQASLLIESGVKVELVLLDISVAADIKWMDFILGQIIMNAVKYRSETPVLRFVGRREENRAVLTVEDNGAGIAKKDVGRVFEKGFTGENGRVSAKSTGIGLYLCKRLCNKMGLGLTIESELGKGTAVSVAFPVSRMHGLLW